MLALGCRADPVPEFRMKAAFLYNFVLYTEWPKAADPMFRLCVLSQDFLGESFSELEGQDVNGRKIHVIYLTSPLEARSCQALYLGEAERERVKIILRDLGDAPVLTVGDAEDMARLGVMIVMFPESRRLVFSLNAEPIRRARLAVSARLLRLARNVN